MRSMKVQAIIVTYKRAEVLGDCLNAVLNRSRTKVSKLHVVVNSTDKKTLEVIEKYRLKYPEIVSYMIYDNLGPAGGFHQGIKYFLDGECDYVWLMDDDILPDENCLTELIKCTEESPYIFPKVFKPNGEEVISFGWWGVLVSRIVIEKIGLPIKELFYWAEDTEYLQNRIMREFKINPYRSQTAIVEHLHNRSSTRPFWYYYYTIRNTLYYRTRIFPLNKRGRKRLVYQYLGSFYRVIFSEPDKIKKASMIFLGTFHGLKGKIGKIKRFHN